MNVQWFKSLGIEKSRKPGKGSTAARGRARGKRLTTEQLECRRLLAGLVVNSALDNFDPASPTTDGVVTLREAILAANTDTAVGDAPAGSGADTITFDAGVFTGGANSVIRLSGTELLVTESLTIDGSAATGLVITADSAGNDALVSGTFVTDVAASLAANAASLNDNSRVLNFSAITGDLTLDNLTITGGRVTGFSENGGGILFGSNGTLTVTGSVISGNSTMGQVGDGGGIYTYSGNVTLTNSTVSGNRSGSNGGGIWTTYGKVTLTNSTVSGNSAPSGVGVGGGIVAARGDVELTNSTVGGNQSGDRGGGIFTNVGRLELTNSTVSGNRSGRGGGIQSRGVITLTRSTVSGNHSDTSGGGIRSGGDLTLTRSTVSGNQNGKDGGGIFTSSGDVELNNSTISGNQSDGDGGGISTSSGNVTLTRSTVSGNQSGDNGGGIFTRSGGVTLTNSTVSGNQSGDDGGGIRTDDSTVLIDSSTITGNTAGGVGGGVGLIADNNTTDERLTVRNSIIAGNSDNGTAPDLRAVGDPANDQVVEFSLIGDTTGSGVTAATGTGNLLNVGPLLGPLTDNGGPTRTHALLVGSPAIDAGDPNFDINGPDGVPDTDDDIRFDQRGIGFARVFGGRLDIGAFEANDFVAPTVDIVDVSPDPRNSAVGVVTINFDEGVTGVDLGDLTLTRNGASVDIGSLTLNQVSPSQYTLDLSSVTSPEGNYELKVNASGSGIQDLGGNLLSTDAIDQFMIDLTGPQAESVVVNGGETQRSMVSELTVTFSEVVNGVDANSFILTNTTTGTQVTPTVTSQVLNGKTVATLTFTGSQFIGGSLADGNYTLTILASVVSDAAGNQLDGNGDGTGGDNATDQFFRFFGDHDGDRDVDAFDFLAFRRTYRRDSSNSSFDAAFDFDGDGDVDALDFLQFRRRYRRSLAP